MITLPKKPLGRALDRIVRIFSTFALVVAMVQLPAAPAFAASDVPGGADLNPPQYVLNDHTAYAIHYAMTGLPASTALNVNVRLSKTGTAGGFTDARGFTFNPALGRWVQTREGAASFPGVVTDASGNVSGWVYWKVGDENFTGFGAAYPPLTATQGYLTISMQTPTGGGTYNGLSKFIVNILDAKTQGAWVHNGVATGAAAAKRAEALKSDDASMSYSLQKTEANVLDDDSNGVVDDENFGPAGATGDFRFGVPQGTTMNVKLNQVAWAPGQGVSTGPSDSDVAIGATDVTPPSAPADLVATPLDGAVQLDWTAASDAGGSGLSAYKVYRLVPGTFGDLTLQSAVPTLAGDVAAGTTTFTDTGLANGTSYSYYVRAADTDTNVSPRSGSATATPFVADTTAPAATTDLAVSATATESVTLGWTAPGDDGSTGTATAYDVRYSTSPITDDAAFGLATQATGEPTPQLAGSIESFEVTGLVTGTPYYFAMKAVDDNSNWSALSNSVSGTPEVAPDGTMTINGGASTTTTTAVTIDSAVTGTVDMRWREAAGTWSDWTAYAASVPFELSTGDGIKTVEAEYRSSGGKITALSDTISLDTGAPEGTMSVNNDSVYTTSTAVSVDSTVTGAVEMRVRDAAGAWSDWAAYAAATPLTLTAVDGLKTVEAQYRDAAGNILIVSDTITLDTEAPSGVMALNNGASYTTTRAVSVDSTVTGATEMRVRNIGGAGNWGSWIAYSAAVAQTTQSGDGTKTVEAQYRDAAGNATTLSDTIYLDTMAPSGTMALNNGALFTKTRATTLNSSITGATLMRLRNIGGAGNWGSWIAYSATTAHTVSSTDGLKTMEAEYADAAGNAIVLSDTITLDTFAPTTSSNATTTYVSSASITLTPTDATSGVAQTLWWFGDPSSATSGTLATVSGVGSYTLSWLSVDAAGNRETTKTADFDITAPTVQTISGNVTAAGVPLNRIVVTAFDAATNASVKGTFTDNLGNYSIALPAGSYHIRFTGTSPASLSQYYDHKGSIADATVVDLAPSANVTVSSDLAPVIASQTISGTITNNGTPLNRIVVTAFDAATNASVRGTFTDANGNYMLSLPVGSYHLRFTGTTPASLSQFYDHKSSITQAAIVELGAGANVTVSSDLAPPVVTTQTISGTITSSSEPLTGIVVSVFDATTHAHVKGVFTNASGDYTLSLPAGTYHVRFTGTPPGLSQYYDHQARITAATPVVVATGAAVTVTSDLSGPIAP
ncbi:MAG: hypothetical protein HGB10_09885 [Coriobacteriia bacterium]|nr:hypothetical protein [Coriobacteriia bacterium]